MHNTLYRIDEQRVKMGLVLLETVILFFMCIMLYYDNEHAEQNVGTFFDVIIILVHVPAMAYSVVRDPRYYIKRNSNSNGRSKTGRQQFKTYESQSRVPMEMQHATSIEDDDDLVAA